MTSLFLSTPDFAASIAISAVGNAISKIQSRICPSAHFRASESELVMQRHLSVETAVMGSFLVRAMMFFPIANLFSGFELQKVLNQLEILTQVPSGFERQKVLLQSGILTQDPKA